MKQIKKSIAVVVALLFMGVYSGIAKENVVMLDFGACEDHAIAVYYATLANGGTWQQANQNYHDAYISCCENYPNDCGGLVIIK